MIQNKYHKPIKQNLEYIEKQIADGARVLEIGPGTEPFSKATVTYSKKVYEME